MRKGIFIGNAHKCGQTPKPTETNGLQNTSTGYTSQITIGLADIETLHSTMLLYRYLGSFGRVSKSKCVSPLWASTESPGALTWDPKP